MGPPNSPIAAPVPAPVPAPVETRSNWLAPQPASSATVAARNRTRMLGSSIVLPDSGRAACIALL